MAKRPVFRTQVEVHVGNHPSGLREVRLEEVITDYDQWNQEVPFASLEADDQRRWHEHLLAIHSVELEIAHLDVEMRELVKREIFDNDIFDPCHTELERMPQLARAIIAAVR